MSPRAIDVRYGRNGWHADTMFVQQVPEDGEIEITTPMMIIRLGAEQADALLEELRAFRDAK